MKQLSLDESTVDMLLDNLFLTLDNDLKIYKRLLMKK